MNLVLIFILATYTDDYQGHAMREARMMAEAGKCEHLLGCAPTAKFSGVGRSKHPYPKTCLPWEHNNKARRVIADAIVHRDGWYYRSTHWR